MFIMFLGLWEIEGEDFNYLIVKLVSSYVGYFLSIDKRLKNVNIVWFLGIFILFIF